MVKVLAQSLIADFDPWNLRTGREEKQLYAAVLLPSQMHPGMHVTQTSPITINKVKRKERVILQLQKYYKVKMNVLLLRN